MRYLAGPLDNCPDKDTNPDSGKRERGSPSELAPHLLVTTRAWDKRARNLPPTIATICTVHQGQLAAPESESLPGLSATLRPRARCTIALPQMPHEWRSLHQCLISEPRIHSRCSAREPAQEHKQTGIRCICSPGTQTSVCLLATYGPYLFSGDVGKPTLQQDSPPCHQVWDFLKGNLEISSLSCSFGSEGTRGHKEHTQRPSSVSRELAL